jgi:hypothetical protein
MPTYLDPRHDVKLKQCSYTIKIVSAQDMYICEWRASPDLFVPAVLISYDWIRSALDPPTYSGGSSVGLGRFETPLLRELVI